ncbi:hypothetical protein FOXB_13870 [Fusarium oxysporum f. sp. conglutinans Fo5176]|uniref:Uncharacterized protein n=1 Tax=Fusarium oxysporum (strain Fo5176) TaxID=660025 RepID=F9G5D8_FUSOF|nr:hypothetical protein FOXB_13870 [Fusarium oxysporum f. sp. conglutinans Fo5176]
MKYSAVAILSLVQGIVAAPSFLEKIKGSKPKALSTDQDISTLTAQKDWVMIVGLVATSISDMLQKFH